MNLWGKACVGFKTRKMPQSLDDTLKSWDSKLTKGAINGNFRTLERLEHERLSSHNKYLTSIGENPSSARRNRYSDILPFDDNYVHLRSFKASATRTEIEPVSINYFNGSEINFGTERYIATQVCSQVQKRHNLFLTLST